MGSRMKRWLWRMGWLVLSAALMVANVSADAYDVIVCGSGGTADYSAQFVDWGKRLRAVLTGRMGHSESHVTLLTETGAQADGVSSVEAIRQAVRDVAGRAGAGDDVFVFLIGHGSYRQQAAKVNVPGPDLSADALKAMLKDVHAARVAVIDAASASAPFVNVLSEKGRIVCTSTHSAEERNATRFMGFFIQALEDGSADQDRDERISVLEACRRASALTQAWYEGEGYIATEHALLDDNGDGLGSRLSDLARPEKDGAIAAHCFLMDFQVPAGVSPQVVADYRAALADVEALIAKKAAMDSTAYYQALEEALVRAARLHREIKTGH